MSDEGQSLCKVCLLLFCVNYNFGGKNSNQSVKIIASSMFPNDDDQRKRMKYILASSKRMILRKILKSLV